MEKLTVDVIMTSYNKARYIGAALDSIFQQKTDKIKQIYICDDHSTDNTIAVIKSYQERYPNKITLYQNVSNLGVCKNTRFSLTCGTSPLVAILDADDLWSNENKIELMHNAMIENPELIACGHGFDVLNANGEIDQASGVVKVRDTFDKPFQKFTSYELINRQYWWASFIHVNSLLFRRETINRIFTDVYIPIYDSFNHGDNYRYKLYAMFDEKRIFGYFVAPMAIYRVNETSDSVTRNPLLNHLNTIDMLLTYRNLFPESMAVQKLLDQELKIHSPYLEELFLQAKNQNDRSRLEFTYKFLQKIRNKDKRDEINFRRIFNENFMVSIIQEIKTFGLFDYIKIYKNRLCTIASNQKSELNRNL